MRQRQARPSGTQVVDRFSPMLIETNDLIVDRTYEGGRSGNAGDDRLSKTLGVSNQGGFRYLGTPDALKLVVITSSFNDSDWPDFVDKESGLFIYFGDNKHPGRLLHETPRKGNLLLQNIFGATHAEPPQRHRVPPILVFRTTGVYRDVEFLGLAVPGAEGWGENEDLVAIWKTSNRQRFQNYRAAFTILDVAKISRAWINDIRSGTALTANAPGAWSAWVQTGIYLPLKAVRTLEHRNRAQQLPDSEEGLAIVNLIHGWFQNDPVAFEACAGAIVGLMDKNLLSFDLTRPSRDGGRDATGKYRIGDGPSAILVDCAIEAKCYGIGNSVGVRETSRLISRLRHRQFGVLVTTSYLHDQAYREIKEDEHPIMVISAVDIVSVLAKHGMNREADVRKWLEAEFPRR
jgi:hypothetical protein